MLDNTPWWLPDVTVGGAAGMLLQRCDPFGAESKMTGLEGGFYGPEHLGQHMWHCEARADGKFRMRCKCGHRGKPVFMCYGHARMFRQRMANVCPPCVHPPKEIQIQADMQATRERAYATPSMQVLDAAESRLWDLQHELNELVERGIVHRCPVILEEVSLCPGN
jgi:hypothetical protein